MRVQRHMLTQWLVCHAACFIASSGMSSPVDVKLDCLWSELVVNGFYANYKITPSTAALGGDTFVVAWRTAAIPDVRPDEYQEAGTVRPHTVFAQLISGLGEKVRPEFLVPSAEDREQINPNVVALSAEHFVIAWWQQKSHYTQESGREGVFVQIFDSSGVRLGEELHVSNASDFSYSRDNHPGLAALCADRFVVVWSSIPDLYAQIFDVTGTKLSLVFRVNSRSEIGEDAHQAAPDASPRAMVSQVCDDRFVVVWVSSLGISFQLFDQVGAMIGEERVAALSGTSATVSAVGNQSFVIVWQEMSPSGLFAQLFNISGDSLGSVIQVNSEQEFYIEHYNSPAVTFLGDDIFVVVWAWYITYAPWPNNRGEMPIVAQILNVTGAKVGNQFQVSSSPGYHSTPGLVSLGAHQVVFVWQSPGGYTSHISDILASMYALTTSRTTANSTSVYTNEDECTAGTSNCDSSNAVCTDTVGSFTCACNAGWTTSNNGVTCTNEDECTAGTSNCDSRTGAGAVTSGSRSPMTRSAGMRDMCLPASWSETTATPQSPQLHAPGFCEHNGMLYLVGTRLNERRRRPLHVFEFDVSSLHWKQLSSEIVGSAPTHEFPLAAHGGHLYIFENSVLLEFDIFSRSWADKTTSARGTLPTTDHRHGLVAHNASLYVFGGRRMDGQQYTVNDFHEYDIAEQEWKDLSLIAGGSAPSPRELFGFCSDGSSLYVFGGNVWTGSSGWALDDLHEFSFVKQEWRLLAVFDGSGPSARWYSHLVADEHKLFVFGGSVGYTSSDEVNDLYQYNLETGVWSDLSQPQSAPAAIQLTRMVILTSILFVYTPTGTGMGLYQYRQQNCGTPLPSSMPIASVHCTVTGPRSLSTSGARPGARDGHALVASGNKLYAYGGIGGPGGLWHDLWEYDVDSQIWTDISRPASGTLPKRTSEGFAAWGGKLYLFGGQPQPLTNDVHEFDISTRMWTTHPNPCSNVSCAPSARFNHGVAVWNGVLYVFGGEEAFEWDIEAFYTFEWDLDYWSKNDLHSYNLTDQTWSDLSSPLGGLPPRSRTGSRVAAFNNKLYVFGGAVENIGRMNDLHEYDIFRQIWRDLSSPLRGEPPSSDRGGFGFVAFHGKLYVSGGRGHGLTRAGFGTTDLHEYDFASASWQVLSDSLDALAPGRGGHGFVVSRERLFVHGGRDCSSYCTLLADFYEYSCDAVAIDPSPDLTSTASSDLTSTAMPPLGPDVTSAPSKTADSLPSATSSTPLPSSTPVAVVPSPSYPGKVFELYDAAPERLLWPDAEERCVALGGHLAIIMDRAEDDALTDGTPGDVWNAQLIGINDVANEGEWRWAGLPDMVPPYTNWYSPEPNDGGDGAGGRMQDWGAKVTSWWGRWDDTSGPEPYGSPERDRYQAYWCSRCTNGEDVTRHCVSNTYDHSETPPPTTNPAFPTVSDTSGHGHDGHFNGASDRCVVVPDDADSLDMTTAYTIAAWIWHDGGGGVIVGKSVDSYTDHPNYRFSVRYPHEGNFLMVWGGNGQLTQTSFAMPMKEWVHVAYAGSVGRASFFVNRVEHPATWVVGPVDDAPFTIGCANGGIPGSKLYPFQGFIDNLALWNVELTSTEVGAVMNAGTGDSAFHPQIRTVGLVAAWDFGALFSPAPSQSPDVEPPETVAVIVVVRLRGSISSFLEEDRQRSAFDEAVRAIAGGMVHEITFLSITDAATTALRSVTAGHFDVEFSAELSDADAAQRFAVQLQEDETALRQELSDRGLALAAVVHASVVGATTSNIVLTTPPADVDKNTEPISPPDAEPDERGIDTTVWIALSFGCGALALSIASYVCFRVSRQPRHQPNPEDPQPPSAPAPHPAPCVVPSQPRQDRLVPLLDEQSSAAVIAQPAAVYPNLVDAHTAEIVHVSNCATEEGLYLTAQNSESSTAHNSALVEVRSRDEESTFRPLTCDAVLDGGSPRTNDGIPVARCEEFCVLQHLSSGQHCRRFKAIWTRDQDRQEVLFCALRPEVDLVVDGETLQLLGRHEHLAPVLAHSAADNDEDARCLVFELPPLGMLDTVLGMRSRDGISNAAVLAISRQICSGMAALVARGVVHGHITTSSVLVFGNDPSDVLVKICEYGLASATQQRRQGLVRWMAPERFGAGEPPSQASDVWSFGVLMWELWNHGGAVPYAAQTTDDSVRDFVRDGGRLARPERCPSDAFDILARCWDASPVARPSFSQLETDLLLVLGT